MSRTKADGRRDTEAGRMGCRRAASCLAAVAIAAGTLCLSSCGESTDEAGETLRSPADKPAESAKPDAKTQATNKAGENTTDEKK